MDRSRLHREYVMAQTARGSVRRAYWKANDVPGLARDGVLRLQSGNLAKAKPDQPVDPRKRADVHEGWIFAGEANKGVHHALDAIAKVHGVPADLKKADIHVTGSLGGANGMYHLDQSSKIQVSKYSFGPASTIAHEYGHYLDHNLFGNSSYGMKGLGTVRRSKELSGVMNAIYRSEAVKNLVKKADEHRDMGEQHGQRLTGYLLMSPELFARSYAQYIGLRGSKQIHEETAAYGRAWKAHGYDAQWSDKDFEPIAREFDKLFAHRRLSRVRQG